MSKRGVVVFGPSLAALSGVSTHVRMLIGSDLAQDFELLHFQVGSEGRGERALGRLLRLALSPWQLALLLWRTKAGAVHLNTSLDPKGYWRDLVYAGVAKAMGRRVVNQIHGGWMPQAFFRGKAVRTWLLRRFLVSSDAVTVLSTAELAAYRAFDPRIRVSLVPNAIDPDGLADRPRAYNADRPLRLVYVGRLARAKGLFEAIDALRALARGGREFELRIAGEGAAMAELLAAVEAAGVKDRVRFLGPVFGSDKTRLWLESDVFVFPSYSEGLPYALLEAMAAGCVPVTTPVAAIPDVIRDGVHGLLVAPKDVCALALALAALDDDRARLERMARAARDRVLECYTIDRLAGDFRAVYRECLA